MTQSSGNGQQHKSSLRPIEKGIFLAILAYACYSFAAFLIKLTPLSFQLIAFARNLIGLFVFLPFFLQKKEQLKTKRLGFHLIRSILSLATIYCSIYGIQHLHLGDAILLEQTAPFFIPCISFIWCKEKVSLSHALAILLAFIGVGYILKPHFDLLKIGAIAALGAGILAALCFVCMQSLTKSETPLSILFYFLLICSVLSIGPAFSCWREITSLSQIFLLFGIGILFALFQLFLTQALTFTNANVIGSYTYFTAIFSTLLGVFFLGEILTLSRGIGSTLIIGAGIYVFYERKKEVKKAISAEIENNRP